MTCTDIAEQVWRNELPYAWHDAVPGLPRQPRRLRQNRPGLVGSSIDFAYAVKAGSWAFLDGHEAFDFAHGLAPEVEGPPVSC
jgi:hypothetical protein